jgi:hypothetical protein
VDKARFDDYIRRFNAEDDTAFDDYLHPDMHMRNGTLEYTGVQGMKDHYARIWGRFREVLDVRRFVSDDDSVAIKMLTHFEALVDDDATIFGPVHVGDAFDFDGVIMYELADDGRFLDIQVAYNSFSSTPRGGVRTEIGIPH